MCGSGAFKLLFCPFISFAQGIIAKLWHLKYVTISAFNTEIQSQKYNKSFLFF